MVRATKPHDGNAGSGRRGARDPARHLRREVGANSAASTSVPGPGTNGHGYRLGRWGALHRKSGIARSPPVPATTTRELRARNARWKKMVARPPLSAAQAATRELERRLPRRLRCDKHGNAGTMSALASISVSSLQVLPPCSSRSSNSEEVAPGQTQGRVSQCPGEARAKGWRLLVVGFRSRDLAPVPVKRLAALPS